MPSTQNRITMQVRLWHDKRKRTRYTAVVIWQRDNFIVIPIDKARAFVDQVHDLLDHDPRY